MPTRRSTSSKLPNNYALQEQEQLKADNRDIRRECRDIRRECCALACELEDQEAEHDALKSLAARLAATSRT